MSQENTTTIASYEQHIQDYIIGTPAQASSLVLEWLDNALIGLPLDAAILELGSAFGRDAKYVESKGFSVQCSDVTLGFVELLQKSGLSAYRLNAITDDLKGQYDLILANAVLLHFTRAETEVVLGKVYDSLKKGGRFAFTVKQGEADGWSEAKINAPRYFCYWEKDELRTLLTKVGFKEINVVDNVLIENTPQIQVIVKK